MTSYADFVTSVESPDGRDNAAGSGAFSKYQFMPATAAEFARKTPWGADATPANVRALVMADPTRADQIFSLYNARSKDALATAGMPTDNTSMLALHRFGQGGGTSLLRASGAMPVADWVKSVNWGPGIAPEAVMRQNGLGRYANVADLRNGFLGGPREAPVATAFEAPAPAAPEPAAPLQQAPQALDPATALSLAGAFDPPTSGPKAKKAPPRRLFG